jgi:ParB-like nuclease family protein
MMASSVTAHESWVGVDQLKPNSWNANQMSRERYRKELASIRRWGLVSPIIVRTVPGGALEIIDGEHRWLGAKELGLKEVPIWDIGRIADPEAKQLSIVLNELRGEPDPEKLGFLLRDLLTSETTESLLEVLPWDEREFAKLAELEQFDWNDLEEPPKGTDNREWVERIYRMPHEVAEVVDQALEKGKREIDGKSTDWQALEVVAANYLAS